MIAHSLITLVLFVVGSFLRLLFLLYSKFWGVFLRICIILSMTTWLRNYNTPAKIENTKADDKVLMEFEPGNF